ncbi:MAG: hypothetical protein AAF628_26805 [Planctomycetota bacterium]
MAATGATNLGFVARAWPSGRATVAAKQPAEPFVDEDSPVRAPGILGDNALVADALMRPLAVVVLNELGERSAKVSFTEQDQTTEALRLHRSDESLGDRVHVGRLGRRRQEGDARVLEDPLELSGELAVPIQNEETLVAEGAVDRVREVACDLRHEGAVGAGRDAGDLDGACRVVNHEQHVVGDESACGPQTSAVNKSKRLVLFDRGQMSSFDAVFSPRDWDGRPQPMYDRERGAIDAGVVAAWRRYDIGLPVRERWRKLRPLLAVLLCAIDGEVDGVPAQSTGCRTR